MKLYYNATFNLYDLSSRIYPTFNEGMICLDTKTDIIEGYFTGDYVKGKIDGNIFSIEVFINQMSEDFSSSSIHFSLEIPFPDKITFPEEYYDLSHEGINFILNIEDKIQNNDKIDSFLQYLQDTKILFGIL